jgi:hydroxymethylpyrimidine pyrophosphatase-like HAD family hydrolase
MGNASPIAKEAADFVMDETNNDGGAGAAIEVFGFGQLL